MCYVVEKVKRSSNKYPFQKMHTALFLTVSRSMRIGGGSRYLWGYGCLMALWKGSPPPPVYRMTYTSEHSTLPHTSYAINE